MRKPARIPSEILGLKIVYCWKKERLCEYAVAKPGSMQAEFCMLHDEKPFDEVICHKRRGRFIRLFNEP